MSEHPQSTRMNPNERRLSRRMVLKRLGALGAFAMVSPRVESAGDREQLDRFGGLKSVRLQPSGFFRVGKKAKRWWFVTPDGAGISS